MQGDGARQRHAVRIERDPAAGGWRLGRKR